MKKLQVKNFIVPIMIALVLFNVVPYLNGGFFGAEEYRAESLADGLANCFTIPGLFLMCIAGLSWISSLGTFDIFVYGTGTVIGYVIKPVTDKLPRTYYDYKAEKDERGRKWSVESLIVGGAFTAIGMIFVIISLIS
jgi:hypothetical protein